MPFTPDKNQTQQPNLKQEQQQLKVILEHMPNEVPLILFTSKGKNEAFTKATQKVLRVFREATSKISLMEVDLNHPLAKKWNVDAAPTLLFDPDHYHIRWHGAPIGEEGRSFFEAVMMLGYGKTNVSDASLKMLNRIDSKREVKLFVSLTCSYCPQQAVNTLKAAIERPDLVSLEIIDVQSNQDLAEKYLVEGVPMTYANEKLVALGAQTEELFFSSLEKLEQQRVFIPEIDAKEVEVDLVVVGGGPAGLTAGIYAARSGLKTAVVERSVLGGQVALTPSVDNYPGLTHVGGKALVDLLVSHALEYVPIFPSEEVLEIVPGRPSIVKTTRRNFTTKAVLLATGANYQRLGVPGENRLQGHGVSYCSTCDGNLFVGKKVIQVGGGNSAVTDALHLHHIGVDVTLVHRRDKLRAQEFLVNSLQQAKIPVRYNTEVSEIQGKDKVEEVVLRQADTGNTEVMPVDGVFIAVGYIPTVDLAQKLGLELDAGGYIKHDNQHRTNVAGIYSAGDVEGGYKQIVTAVGQGASAAMSIFEELIHPYWKTGKEDVHALGQPRVTSLQQE